MAFVKFSSIQFAACLRQQVSYPRMYQCAWNAVEPKSWDKQNLVISSLTNYQFLLCIVWIENLAAVILKEGK